MWERDSNKQLPFGFGAAPRASNNRRLPRIFRETFHFSKKGGREQMAIACLEKENLISIGDISEMYDISKRTLRLYHEMGLLVPAKVDEWTGYRYYEQSQTERLDLILQMKSSGLTLKQIRELLDTENLNTFEAVLGKQVEELSRKIAECRICQDSLLRKMDSFRYIRNPPPENEPFLEYIPRRPALVMDIEPYDILKEYPKGSPWKKALGVVKRIFLENDVPMAL